MENKKENIYEKLLAIQCELKAPKSQYNKFGKYNYRNCEDILEAVKPFCLKYGAVLKIHDVVVLIGDRYYIKAKAVLRNIDSKEELPVESVGYARECLDKKGMDDAQLTGSCSSYARKYALNGLFCIDDTKDADHDSNAKPEKLAEKKKTYLTPKFLKLMAGYKVEIGEEDYYKILKTHGYDHANEIAPANQEGALKVFAKKLEKIVEKREHEEVSEK